MSNDTVVALRNALERVTQERQQKHTDVVRRQEAVDRAHANVQRVEEQAKRLEYEQQSVKKEMETIRGLLNSSTEKSRALEIQFEKLQKDHAEAFSKSQAVGAMVRQTQQALRDAQTDLGMTRNAYDDVQGQWQEISDLLQREMNT